MNLLDNFSNPLFLGRVLTFAMIAVLFLQSGIDKLLDWKGNLSWLTGHFEATIFRHAVPFLLAIVTCCELAAGIAACLGIGQVLLGGGVFLARISAGLACLSILMLFTGQRIAKDYPGAASLVPYFLLCLAGLLLTGDLSTG